MMPDLATWSSFATLAAEEVTLGGVQRPRQDLALGDCVQVKDWYEIEGVAVAMENPEAVPLMVLRHKTKQSSMCYG